MKALVTALLLLSAGLLGGCSTGVFQSSADYQRTDYAKEVKHDIDRQIRAEIFKEPPPGSTSPTYSASDWSRYWVKEVAKYRTAFPASKAYQGPAGKWFADYIVSTRRTEGLPELPVGGDQGHPTKTWE